MAIKIIKQGIKELRAICPHCYCEFSYEEEDVYDNMLVCPCCGAVMLAQDVTCATAKPITNPNGIYNPHQVNDLVYRPFPLPDWATKSDNWSGCEGCPNNPKYLKTPYVGDSPCQWCQKSPWKVTCTSNMKQ